MCVGRRRFNRFLILANGFTIPASLSNRILIHHWNVGDGIADGVTGLLYGVVFGLYFVGIRKMMREDGGAGGESCA